MNGRNEDRTQDYLTDGPHWYRLYRGKELKESARELKKTKTFPWYRKRFKFILEKEGIVGYILSLRFLTVLSR